MAPPLAEHRCKDCPYWHGADTADLAVGLSARCGADTADLAVGLSAPWRCTG